MKIVRLFCEWDICHEDKLFTSKEKAKAWAEKALEACGITDTFDDLKADGLIGFQALEVTD